VEDTSGEETRSIREQKEDSERKGRTGDIRRRALGFSFCVQLYAGALNMHDAWALKLAAAFHCHLQSRM